MSHFIGIVFSENEHYEDLLAPYDESIEVEPYIRFTKDEAIADAKETHRKLFDVLYTRESGLNEAQKEIIAQGREISVEVAWKKVLDWGYEIDEKENLLSTYNPKSKWDWYVPGGRWKDYIPTLDGYSTDYTTVGDVDWNKMFEDGVPFCFVDVEGNWHESAEMHWWAMTSNEKNEQEWLNEFKSYVKTLNPDICMTAIDFHI